MPFLPYLDAPRWARMCINACYTLFYAWIILLAAMTILSYPYIWLDISMGLMLAAAVLAILSVWKRTPDWEWSASIFIIGGIVTFLVVQYYEVFTGATVGHPVLDSSTGAGALFMLTARSILLYVAAQKNKAYAQAQLRD